MITAHAIFPEAKQHTMKVDYVDVLNRPLELPGYYAIHRNYYFTEDYFVNRLLVKVVFVNIPVEKNYRDFVESVFGKCDEELVPVFTSRKSAQKFLNTVNKFLPTEEDDYWTVSKFETKVIRDICHRIGFTHFFINPDLKYADKMVDRGCVLSLISP